jgi:hypothetical protein
MSAMVEFLLAVTVLGQEFHVSMFIPAIMTCPFLESEWCLQISPRESNVSNE